MLKKIKIENFFSINQSQELSFSVLKKDILDDSACAINEKEGINLVSSFIGANASGKTNILKAFVFLFWFIENGYSKIKEDDPTGAEPFKLNTKKPSHFEIEFFNQEKLYKYSITLNLKQVISEHLSEKNQRAFSTIFEYVRHKDDWNLKTSKLIINNTDCERFKKRSNVSLLSSLINTGYLSDIRFFKDGVSNVVNTGISQDPWKNFIQITDELFKNDSLKDNVLSFIQRVDMGISDFNFKDVTFLRKNSEEEKKVKLLQCIHNVGKESFALPVFLESNGTQNAIQILSEIFIVLSKGSIASIDEIDQHLHPDIVRKIISLFENKETNPKNAQILFSTHQHLLLNDRTKTQIFLVNKNDKTLETEVSRLDDIKGIRNDDNYFHKYITGSYGGTPDIKWL